MNNIPYKRPLIFKITIKIFKKLSKNKQKIVSKVIKLKKLLRINNKIFKILIKV